MNKPVQLLLVATLLLLVFADCNKKSPTKARLSTMTDIDGNVYNTVTIGDQVWMAQNLRVTHYRDSSRIDWVADSSEWMFYPRGAWCAYEGWTSLASSNGYLYNWYAVNDSRNIAPAGWHVPTDEDWQELEMSLGMSPLDAEDWGFRGADEGSKLAGSDNWKSGALRWSSAFGESGFLAGPCGVRINGGGFYGYWEQVGFWSSTMHSYGPIGRFLRYDESGINRTFIDKGRGISIRLVKDNQ